MKVLLTGEPRCGKTTMLENFVEAVPKKQGFVTREILENAKRVGFELVSAMGRTSVLASLKSDSPDRVLRCGVEVDSFDDFMRELPTIDNDSLLYIDEIAQMQLFSELFKQLVTEYLDSSNPYVGTISNVFSDDFIEKVLARQDIVLISISKENRDQVTDVMRGLATSIFLLQQLSPAIQEKVTEMARDYANNSNLIQLKKLFNNAIHYLVEGRVKKIDRVTYSVNGNSDMHLVTVNGSDFYCDCDLFNGVGEFEMCAGECSHIQTVKLFV